METLLAVLRALYQSDPDCDQTANVSEKPIRTWV